MIFNNSKDFPSRWNKPKWPKYQFIRKEQNNYTKT